MEEFLELFKNKKNLINLLILGILILALPLGIGLIRTQQILKSRAVEPPIVFTGSNVFTLPDGKKAFKLNEKEEAKVAVQITAPFPPAPATQSGTLTQSKGLISTVYADDCDPEDPDDDSCHPPPDDTPPDDTPPDDTPPDEGGAPTCSGYSQSCFDDQDRQGTQWCSPGIILDNGACGFGFGVTDDCTPCDTGGDTDTDTCVVNGQTVSRGEGNSMCGAFWGQGASCHPDDCRSSSCDARGDGCFGGTGAEISPSPSPRVSPSPSRAPTCNSNVEEARRQLNALGGNFRNATCQQIIDKVKNDCTIFKPPNTIRDALAPGTCGTTCEPKVEEARKKLIELGGDFKNKTCQQIKDHVKNDCTIFKPPDPIRDALAPGTCVTAIFTTHFRIAETRAGLVGVEFETYDEEVETRNFTFKEKTPGEKFVFVEFKLSDNKTVIKSAQIELVFDPKITSCTTKLFDDRVEFTLKGENFAGKGTAKSEDIAKGEKKDLVVKSWKDKEIVASLQGPPIGQTFPIHIKNDKGLEADGSCSSIAQLALGAKLFCRAPQQFDVDEVQIVIAEGVDKGRVSKEKVKINKKGVVEGLTARLIEGQGYKISVKAPKSLRRVKEFIVKAGTTILADFNLPVGDIFPLAEGDGKINALDRAQLIREWRLLGASQRAGDFNGDGLVNSFDWACMRQDFGQSDDDEPIAGPLTSITPTTGGPIGIGITSPAGIGTTTPSGIGTTGP